MKQQTPFDLDKENVENLKLNNKHQKGKQIQTNNFEMTKNLKCASNITKIKYKNRFVNK